MITVTEMDHIVLRVADVERSLAWYRDRLGLPGVRVDEWRRREAPFPSVRITGDTIIDIIVGTPEVADANLDHLCLVVTPESLAEVDAAHGFDVLEGPVPRFGARGIGSSIYVRDPDANVVELRTYD